MVKRVLTVLASRRTVQWVLAALVLLVIADGFLTNLLIQQDIAHEWNLFLVLLAGKAASFVVRIIGAAVCALILWGIYLHWPRLRLVSAYVFLPVYTGIVVRNLSLYLGARD